MRILSIQSLRRPYSILALHQDYDPQQFFQDCPEPSSGRDEKRSIREHVYVYDPHARQIQLCRRVCVCSSHKSLLPPRASDGQSCTPSAHHRGRPGVRCWSTPPTGAACSSLPLPLVLRGQSGRLVGRVVLLDLGGVHLGGLRRGLPVPAAPLAAAAHAPPRRFGLSHFFTYFEFGNSPLFDFGILHTS